jgi:hypothetical protein
MPSDDSSYAEAGNAFGSGSATSPPGVPSERGGEPRGPRDERWIPLLLVLLAVVGTGLALRRAEHRALADPVQRGQRGDVVGVEGSSLLAAEHLRRAFALIADRLKADEVVTDVDLRPVRLRVAVRDGIGRARSFAVDLAYDVHTEDGGRSTADGPALVRIDTAAPERFARTALARSGAPATALTGLGWRYSPGAGVPQLWTLQLEDVPIADQNWVSDGGGRHARRTGDTVPAVQIVAGRTRVITDPASARRLRNCLRRAGGSRDKQQRCVDALR